MDKHETLSQPPPYVSTEYNPDDAAELLQRLIVVADRELHSESYDAAQESKRVRGFMLFALSIDYQCDTTAVLSASDRQHFAFLDRRLSDIHSARWTIQCTPAERQTLAPFFWKFLHAPSKVFGIPVEYVVMTIRRFFKFADYNGRYKGSIFGIVHNYGLEALAYKLNLDRTVVLPKLLPKGLDNNDQLHEDYSLMLGGVSTRYFKQFPTMDGTTKATTDALTVATRPWDDVQIMTYVPTDRGKAYDSNRLGARMISAALDLFEPAHWRASVEAATTEVRRRHRQVLTLRRWPNRGGSWRGYHDKMRNPTAADSDLWWRPFGWRQKETIHFPDLYEHRPFVNGCET